MVAFFTDAPVVSSNRLKTLLADGASTIFANGKPTFINGPKSYQVILLLGYEFFQYIFSIKFLYFLEAKLFL